MPLKPHIYLVPGLGADSRLFGRIQWPEGYTVTSLKWIEPAGNDEPISEYARRMCSQVDSSVPFVLIGVSLGGIMANEMAHIINPEKVFIISSIKSKKEKPFYFILGKFFRKVSLANPESFLFRIVARIYFTGRNRSEFEILRDMLAKTGQKQILWAQNAVAKWQRTDFPANLTHIHGTSDLLFPVLFIKNYIPIKGGNHYMIVNRAAEISRLLKELI
jgi:hypothetical protein